LLFNHSCLGSKDWIIDYKQLTFLKQIGKGSSCKVYKGRWRGTPIAIKKINITEMRKKRLKEFQREIGTLLQLRPHQNLVLLMGVSQT